MQIPYEIVENEKLSEVRGGLSKDVKCGIAALGTGLIAGGLPGGFAAAWKYMDCTTIVAH